MTVGGLFLLKGMGRGYTSSGRNKWSLCHTLALEPTPWFCVQVLWRKGLWEETWERAPRAFLRAGSKEWSRVQEDVACEAHQGPGM